MYNFYAIEDVEVNANQRINVRRRGYDARGYDSSLRENGADLYERLKKFIRDCVSEQFVVRFLVFSL